MSKFTDKRVGQPVWWPSTSSENLVSIEFVLGNRFCVQRPKLNNNAHDGFNSLL